MRRILLDCSLIVDTDPKSGIQRVVRNIVNHSLEMDDPDIEVLPVAWRNGAFCQINWPPSVRATVASSSGKRRLKRLVKRIAKAALPQAFYGPAGRRNLLRRGRTPAAPAFEFGPNDILMLLDSSWHIPIWREVEAAKDQGAKIGFALYDLIPITHPQFCDDGIVVSFKSWLAKAVTYSDFFLAISHSSRSELFRLFKSAQPALKGEAFKLGADLERAKGGKAGRRLKALFKQPTYISVGTIEPRKNHTYILDAFEALWSAGTEVSLCFIGKIGWHNDDLVSRVKNHPHYGKRLWMLSDLSDAELNFAYQRARAVIIASIQEGFGLPIIEALHQGTPVLASDIPVFREAGKEYCAYFDLNSAGSLTGMVEQYEKSGKLPGVKAVGALKWPSWQDSAQEFIGRTLELSK